MTVNENIRNIREKKGWSRKEFATICGISIPEVYLLDYGATTPTMRTLNKIAQALEIDIKELFGGRDGETK